MLCLLESTIHNGIEHTHHDKRITIFILENKQKIYMYTSILEQAKWKDRIFRNVICVMRFVHILSVRLRFD